MKSFRGWQRNAILPIWLTGYSIMEAIDMATENPNGSDGGRESPFESARRAFGDTAQSFTDQAGARAREFTVQGKDRAVEALDGVASLVGDAATQVSEKLGEQYGGYVRQAAGAVSNLANTLRGKDSDELYEDARNAIRSSPVIAIAAAAAVGFLMARVVKSGLAPGADNEEPDGDRPPAKKPPAVDNASSAA